ncbi:MAG: phosphoethanolamine--lipid A transferase [Campylobacterales bacterium]
MNRYKNHISQHTLILATAIFFVLFDNISFFQNTLKIYSFSGINILYIISLTIVLLSFIVLLFTLVSSKYTTKPILIITLMVSSFTNYFMNNYSVIIDSDMIRNTMQTNYSESMDLLSIKLVSYVVFLGILPSFIVYQTKIDYSKNLKDEMILKLKVILSSLAIIIIMIVSFSKFYTSFFREHKPLRYYTNPTYWIYGTGKYINETYNTVDKTLKTIGEDAKIVTTDKKPNLVIMVVGEATRADKLSLNGYNKETNPLLKKEEIINFSNFYSCGTSTAESVPCMFSVFARDDYNYQKGKYTENVLDILNKTNDIEILWRDNNSDSKGVATRVSYQDYKSSKNNPICDEECRDEGMLVGLDEFIKNSKKKNILIVLHQMGNHGPAYYKRYTKEFKKFTPVCKTNQLEKCSKEEINNAYDNAVLYTDYFLSKTINLLKKYPQYKASMLYISDHGESLGEHGIYLHGLPYFMAPDEQKHIASIFWSNDKNYYKLLENKQDKEFSQDNLFHTLLGLFNVKTKVYKKDLDMLKDKD